MSPNMATVGQNMAKLSASCQGYFKSTHLLDRTCELGKFWHRGVSTADIFASSDSILCRMVSFWWYLISVQNPGWLMIIGDYTTQHIRDYDKSKNGESLLTSQNLMEWQRDFEHCSFDFIWFICKVCHDKQWMLDDLDDPTEIRAKLSQNWGFPLKCRQLKIHRSFSHL